MGVDVTAWAVVGKAFRSRQEVVEFLESHGYDLDDDLGAMDISGFELHEEDGYSRNSSWVLGAWIYSCSNAFKTAEFVSAYAKEFEDIFGIPAEFIVTEHWW